MFAYVNIYKHIPSNVCMYIYTIYLWIRMPRCPEISILRSLAWQILAEWHSDRQDESWADDLCAIWLHDNILRPLELRGKTCSCNSCTSVYCLQCHNKDDIRRNNTTQPKMTWKSLIFESSTQNLSPVFQWHQSCPVASESRKVASKFNPNSLGVGKSLEKTVGFDHFLAGEMLVEGWTRCQITSRVVIFHQENQKTPDTVWCIFIGNSPGPSHLLPLVAEKSQGFVHLFSRQTYTPWECVIPKGSSSSNHWFSGANC